MPQVITTILLDGNPKGLRLIETANWAGKAFVVPRGKLKELKKREDAGQPGLYILFGEGEEKPKAYIGQSENVVDRLFSHDSNRETDEWNNALVFVGNLDSTFIKHLESVSLDLAKKADRFDIFNSASPKGNKLSEAQQIVAAEYFDRIKLIVSLLGYALFEDPKEDESRKETYLLTTQDAEARGTLLETGEFIVFAESKARKTETKSFKGGSPAVLREKYIQNGVLKELNENQFVLTEDKIFSSPSAAAATFAGRAINGWTAWKGKKGKTLDENVRK